MTKPLTEGEYEPIRAALFDRRNNSASEAKQAIADALSTAGYVIRKNEPDHFVTFDEDGWYVEHSIECRDRGDMRSCPHNLGIRAIADNFDPEMVGRWKITNIDSEGLPSLERVPSGQADA